MALASVTDVLAGIAGWRSRIVPLPPPSGWSDGNAGGAGGQKRLAGVGAVAAQDHRARPGFRECGGANGAVDHRGANGQGAAAVGVQRDVGRGGAKPLVIVPLLMA